jgi:Ca2+-binding EF-hand superfamily protein
MENMDTYTELFQPNSELEFLNIKMKLKQYRGIYSFDLIPVAEECFDYFVSKEEKKMNNLYFIEFEELKNLLMVIGIKKNIYEILEKIENIKAYKPKTFFFENKYTKENFIDIVKSFEDYRIEEKFLIQIFNEIDKDGEGYIDIEKVRNLTKVMNLDFTDEEIDDMLSLDSIGSNRNKDLNRKIDYETFCNLFYKN